MSVPSASAAPVLFVTSGYSTDTGVFAPTTTTSTATARTSTSPLDSGNFAAASADASVGSVGIGMATTLPDGASHVSASAGAAITDDWVPCSTDPHVVCGAFINLARVTFNMHFDGTLSPAWLAANAIEGEFKEFSGSFHVANDELDFAWNGTQLAGTFCDTGVFPGVCTPFAFASTTLADGSLAFDANFTFDAELNAPGFSTVLALSADWDSIEQPGTLAFQHTLRFDVVSNDPGLVWVSDAGQMSASASPVPEPGTMPLLGAGLLFLARLARNTRRRG
jgi:hypothetical protein